MSRMVSTVMRVGRRPHAAAAFHRAITALIALTWIGGSLVCPVPALADGAFARAGHSAEPVFDGFDSHRAYGRSHDNGQADVCCDILAQVYTSAGPLNDPLYHQSIPNYAPLPSIGPNLIAAAAINEAVSLQLHGPEPPRQSWPQFTKIWPQAPPANQV